MHQGHYQVLHPAFKKKTRFLEDTIWKMKRSLQTSPNTAGSFVPAYLLSKVPGSLDPEELVLRVAHLLSNTLGQALPLSPD